MCVCVCANFHHSFKWCPHFCQLTLNLPLFRSFCNKTCIVHSFSFRVTIYFPSSFEFCFFPTWKWLGIWYIVQTSHQISFDEAEEKKMNGFYLKWPSFFFVIRLDIQMMNPICFVSEEKKNPNQNENRRDSEAIVWSETNQTTCTNRFDIPLNRIFFSDSIYN